LGRSSLNRNISIVKQLMAERNTALTKEEISKFTGITESYLYSILDLMQALDIVDKVKRGKNYYYFLKGKYDEEQLNSMLPPMKAPASPRIRRTPRSIERSKPVIHEEREVSLLEEQLSSVSARIANYDGLSALALLGLAEEEVQEPSPEIREPQATGPPPLIKVRPFGSVKYLPEDFLLLTMSQTEFLKENYLRGLDGYEDLGHLPTFFAKSSKLRSGYYGGVLYASPGVNPWERLYKVTLDPSILRGLTLPGLEERIWEAWKGFWESLEEHGRYYSMEDYDKIIENFIESGHNLVEITVEDRAPIYVKNVLEKRIKERGMEGKVEVSYVDEWLYLERNR
jgi:hypothetical protein